MKPKLRRWLSVPLSVAMLFCMMPTTAMTITAADEQPMLVVDENPIVTYAQETVQGSAVLHCFDWSFNAIKANLPDIAAAGYTAVQTSPVQPPKDYGATWLDAENQWWKLYQPLGFRIAGENESWLGTRAELIELCTEAENYNIKVIVDVVANHLGNDGSSVKTNRSPQIDSWLNVNDYFHSETFGSNDSSRYNMTRGHIGMPDLNTGNTDVQNYVLTFLEDCMDCGVDGFRFDAAKHIEVPNDPDNCKSNFWPVVINGIKNYAVTQGYSEPFIYGEILGSTYTNSVSDYTDYIGLTDNITGDHILDKTYWKAAESMITTISNDKNGNNGKAGLSATQSVLWVESHDTYMGDSSNGYFYDQSSTYNHHNTSHVDDSDIIKAWAVVGSRADSTSLFFARPNDSMGAASTDDTWKSSVVTEINKFKNLFNGQKEKLAYSGNTVYNVRGSKGIVLSKLDGGGAVSFAVSGLGDGEYTDHITNSTFTVASGVLTGTVGSSGVAVIYNDGDVDEPTITADTLYLVPNSDWKKDSARFAIYLFNESGNSWVSMTDNDSDGTYEAAVPSGKWTNVIFCRMNPAYSTNAWNYVWGQTNDLAPDSGMDCYTIQPGTWSGSSNPLKWSAGSWSTLTPACDHDYNVTNWTWAADNSTATATFTCTGCDDEQYENAEVSVVLGDGTCTYTAAVTRDGTDYTDIRTVNDVTAAMLSKCEAYQNLTDYNKDMYRKILTFARSVVRGEQASSVFTVSPAFQTTWTPEELGVSPNGNNLQQGYSAVGAKIGEFIDTSAVLNALLADWPYEFYWYAKSVNTDKVRSFSCSWSYSASVGSNVWYSITLSDFTITMQVAQRYQNGTTTSFDKDVINTVKNTVPAIAQTIVTQYANASDYAKLQGYSQAICGLTNYNTPATASNWNQYDGDPWQLVYVFDNDPATTVVCEGYSKAFKYLCSLTDFNSSVKCYLVSGSLGYFEGEAFKQGAHMWNVVTMEDGKNYLVDVTNSDDSSNRQPNAFLLNGGSCDTNDWYNISSRNSSSDILYYHYDTGTQTLWGDSILTLNATNYAEPVSYTVTWKNEDGTVLETDTNVTAGTMPSYDGATPTKAATAQYSYTFAGWSPAVAAVTGDVTYTATFTKTTREYTITWKMDDGSTIDTTTVAYGTTPTHADAVKDADAQYTYTFTGWTPTITAVTGEATYTAQFTATPIQAETMTLTAYNFIDWNTMYIYYWGRNDPLGWPGVPMTLVAGSDGLIYTATIPSNVTGVIFNNGDKTAMKQTVDITTGIADGAVWAVYNQTDANGNYTPKEVPTYYLVGTMNSWDTAGAPVFSPNKNDNHKEEYVLTTELTQGDRIKARDITSETGWFPYGEDPGITINRTGTYNIYLRPNRDGNADWNNYVLYAQAVTHTVTFDSNDGSAVESQTVYHNETATAPKTAPAKYGYDFMGWYNGDEAYEFDTPVTGDLTLTAHWEETQVSITYTDINGIDTVTRVGMLTGTYTLPAAPYLDGYDFDGWTVNSVPYKDKDNAVAQINYLVRNGSPVAVRVVYNKQAATYKLIVANGTIKDTDGTTESRYQASEQIYVVADDDSEGHIFSCWKASYGGTDEVVVGYERTYAFRMPAKGVTLTACYVSQAEDVADKLGTAYIESVKSPAANKLSFVSIVSVPSEARIKRAGIIAQTAAELNGAELTVDNARFVRYNDTTCKNYLAFKYTWTKGSVSADDTWCVRAYLVYTQGGKEYTVLGTETVSACLQDFA